MIRTFSWPLFCLCLFANPLKASPISLQALLASTTIGVTNGTLSKAHPSILRLESLLIPKFGLFPEFSSCTAAILNPNTVLTAFHCVYHLEKKRWRQVFIGDYPALRIYPKTPTHDRKKDIALVVFDKKAFSHVNQFMHLSRSRAYKGQSIELVGYGDAGFHYDAKKKKVDSHWGDGVKRSGKNTVDSVNAGVIHFEGLSWAPEGGPTGYDAGGGFGDSGGPLLGSDSRIYGVASCVRSTIKDGAHNGKHKTFYIDVHGKAARDLFNTALTDEFSPKRPLWFPNSGVAPRKRMGVYVSSHPFGGLQIVAIEKNSAAEKSGLVVGDILKKIDQVPVRSREDLAMALHISDRVPLEYWSIHKGHRVNFVFAPDDAKQVYAKREPIRDKYKLGINVKAVEKGLLIEKISQDSAAYAAGMRAGNVLTHISNRALKESEDARDAISRSQGMIQVRYLTSEASGVVHQSTVVLDPYEKEYAPDEAVPKVGLGVYLFYYAVKKGEKSPFVIRVPKGSVGNRVGLKVNDRIVRINGISIHSTNDYYRAINKKTKQGTLTIARIDGGLTRFLVKKVDFERLP